MADTPDGRTRRFRMVGRGATGFPEMVPQPQGDWVFGEDHERALAAAEHRIRELEGLLRAAESSESHIAWQLDEERITRQQAEQRAKELETINAEICLTHNALLADGAKWQTRAEAAEQARDAALRELEALRVAES